MAIREASVMLTCIAFNIFNPVQFSDMETILASRISECSPKLFNVRYCNISWLNISSGSIRVLLNITGKSELFKIKASFSLFGNSERHQGLKIKTSGHQDLKIKTSGLKNRSSFRDIITKAFKIVICKIYKILTYIRIIIGGYINTHDK